jgi:hypothetical protein
MAICKQAAALGQVAGAAIYPVLVNLLQQLVHLCLGLLSCQPHKPDVNISIAKAALCQHCVVSALLESVTNVVCLLLH